MTRDLEFPTTICEGGRVVHFRDGEITVPWYRKDDSFINSPYPIYDNLRDIRGGWILSFHRKIIRTAKASRLTVVDVVNDPEHGKTGVSEQGARKSESEIGKDVEIKQLALDECFVEVKRRWREGGRRETQDELRSAVSLLVGGATLWVGDSCTKPTMLWRDTPASLAQDLGSTAVMQTNRSAYARPGEAHFMIFTNAEMAVREKARRIRRVIAELEDPILVMEFLESEGIELKRPIKTKEDLLTFRRSMASAEIGQHLEEETNALIDKLKKEGKLRVAGNIKDDIMRAKAERLALYRWCRRVYSIKRENFFIAENMLLPADIIVPVYGVMEKHRLPIRQIADEVFGEGLGVFSSLKIEPKSIREILKPKSPHTPIL